MTDENLWREEGPKAFLEFLRTATGEDHDAVVYDTKVEFDPSNPDALRHVACIAMGKGDRVLRPSVRPEYRERFSAPRPSDGSVAAYDSSEGNEAVQRLRAERIYREEHADGPCTYVPDADRYCEMLRGAINRREILYEDMSESEQRRYNRKKITDGISDFLWQLWQIPFYRIVMIILGVCGVLYLILALITALQ